MKTSYIDKRSIQIDKSILDALKIMDSSKTKLLFVFEGEKFEGLLTIGDIPLVGTIAVKYGIHDAVALGVSHKLTAVAD